MQKKILVTGASGYIGRQLIPHLVQKGYHIYALARNPTRIRLNPSIAPHVTLIKGDLERPSTLAFPPDIEAAYYLVHGMSKSYFKFEHIEKTQATNFIDALKKTSVKQVLYLTGLITDTKLSRHLSSRLAVENILKESGIPYTVLRAGIIIGPGSASFEIIRDLVEKLPFMIAPRWVNSKCQPIAARDIVSLLTDTLFHPKCLNEVFDVGTDQSMTYKEMLYGYAKFRGLHRAIVSLPILTPHLSSYWLYIITPTNFFLAMALVDSLKHDAICSDRRIFDILPRTSLNYTKALEDAFRVGRYAPREGCILDVTSVTFKAPRDHVIDRLFSIGGKQGWYALNWAWKIRGWIDTTLGGVGLRRGRTDPKNLSEGDFLDFWRVLVADREHGHLLLQAEMKLPGEAWLEFIVEGNTLIQTASFRPRGLWGRAYWYMLLPIHVIVFHRMPRRLVRGRS